MSKVLDALEGLTPEQRKLVLRRLAKRAKKGSGQAAGGDSPGTASGGVRDEPVRRRRPGKPVPLSFGQQRLWVLDRLDPGQDFFNLSFGFELRGAFDLPVFRAAFEIIVARHEVLRTTFRTSGAGLDPQQWIAPPTDVPLPVVDLEGLPKAQRERAAQHLAAVEARRPFDLERGPLVRLSLLRREEEDHLLVVVMHHIITDAWSFGVLVRELGILYRALGARGSGAFDPASVSELPPLPVQYGDYSLWQRERLVGARLDRELAFWKEQLAGSPPVLELPLDRPRQAVQSYRGGEVTTTLGTKLTEEIEAASQRWGATPFMTLLAAFQVLMARWTGTWDIAVGTPIAGRNRLETEGLIGFFLNNLVLRTRLRSQGLESFTEVLEQVRRRTGEAYSHQEIPFEKLVEELQPERNLASFPLFQVMFILQNAPLGVLDLPGLRLLPTSIGPSLAHFDLTLVLSSTAEGLSGGFEYAVDLLDRSTVQRLSGHFRNLLEGLVADPEQAIGRLPWLSPAQRHQLLREYNDTELNPQERLGIAALFEERAAQTPDAVALVMDDREPQGTGGTALSYGELDRQVRWLAHGLRDQGVGPERVVAIALERSFEMVVAILAAIKAGGVALPLETGHPEERLRFLVSDSRAAVLVVQRHDASFLEEGSDVPVLALDDLAPAPASLPESAVAPPTSPLGAVYQVYTSGSTGRPKGAVIAEQSLATYGVAAAQCFGLAPGDRVLQFASPGFDVVMEELLPALFEGATVVLAEPRRFEMPPVFEQLVAAQRVTCCELPAVFWHEWVDELERAGEHPPPSLRLMILGCDRPDPGRLAAWRRFEVPLLVVFGLTETTITSTTHRASRPAEQVMLPIGRSFDGQQTYLLDQDLEPVAQGTPGHLHIGGEGLARGYFGRPGLTAERFVPNPQATHRGDRLYVTGDRARHLQDGAIDFLGRIDRQLSLRGFRVEPEEIAAVLRRHPVVREAVVTAPRDVGEERSLVAHVVPAEGYDAGRDGWSRRRDGDSQRTEVWPSHGEYPIYDELLYGAMVHDEERNVAYRTAIGRAVEGKVVLDVGTGAEAILSRFCVEAGARKVYAIEVMERSYLKAKARIRELGLEDRIFLIHGNATEVELPELADVCVSELIGCIGGSEGAVAILDSVRHLVKEDGLFIPESCETRIAAVELPEELDEPVFEEAGGHYADRVFEVVGHSFDLRLCLRHLPPENLISPSGVFEDLDFSGPGVLEARQNLRLTVGRRARFGGFLLWIRLHPSADTVVDSWLQECSWLPMYFPVFHPGLEVKAGDVIEVTCITTLADDGLHPDYRVEGRVLHGGGGETPFAHDSFFDRRPVQPSEFHRRLFAPDGRPVVRQESAARLDFADLEAFQRQFLPDPMVVRRFVTLESLPLTPNGKVDVAALPAATPGRLGDDYVAPRKPTEEILAGIWGQVLNRTSIGVTDDFFALGGHSLAAMQVLSRVRQALDVNLGLREVFERPTLGELALAVDAALASNRSARPALLPRESIEAADLSFAQERLWFLQQWEPEGVVYNMPAVLELRGELEIPALASALREVIHRHEVLRTTFEAVDGVPQALSGPLPDHPLAIVDLTGLAEEQRWDEATRQARREAARPLDLAGRGALRSTLMRCGEERHLLLFTLHHIAGDGWSMGLLVREVSVLYGVLEAADPSQPPVSPLAPLPVQYADFAHWQRSWLRGEVLDAELAWWREQLAGLPASLELPTDRPRPALQNLAGAGRAAELEAPLAAALEALGRERGATLFMTLLAAFQVVLWRHSGQRDLCVGTPVAGRDALEVEGLIGCFVNTLVLRTDWASLPGASPTFSDLQERVREVTLGSYGHQDFPFERLVDELAPDRDPSLTPLFQVMFDLDSNPTTELTLPELEIRPLAPLVVPSPFDLTLSLAQSESGLGISLVYATALFDSTTAERLLRHYRTVLTTLAAPEGAEWRLVDLPWWSPAERHQLVVEGNGGSLGESTEGGVLQGFAQQVEAVPDAVALVSGQSHVSYGRLAQGVANLAAELSGLGVGGERRVGLHMHRSPALVTALLAVLQAGGTYVPLDPTYPAERLAFMASDSKLGWILADEPEVPFAIGEGQVLALNPRGELSGGGGAERVTSTATAERLAYVLYTSGSTGRPKGVEVSHGALMSFLLASRSRLDFEAREALPLVTPLSFDISALELFLPLLTGGRVELVDSETAADGRALDHFLRRSRLRRMQATPATWRLLVHAGWKGCADFCVLCGGEPLADDLAQELRQRSSEVWNLYGPTEATVWVSMRQLHEGPVRIGNALANSRLYLLDRHLEPVALGVAAELCLGGLGLARGYSNRPGITAERFVPDALSGDPSSRLYRTGDLARRRPGGEIEFLGRLDHQVKVRGHRIELGEVETGLVRHAAVTQAVARVWQVQGDDLLVAYLVPAASVDLDQVSILEDQLRSELQSRLPVYMVPGRLVWLEALPLTPNGKVDRKALPQPSTLGSAEGYVAPRGAVEARLAKIWQDLLGVDRVGVEDDFFRLGGHSLVATRLMSRLRQAFEVEVPMHRLFAAPTVGALARAVETALRSEDSVVESVPRDLPLPLSFSQQRMWFLDRLEPGGVSYNLPGSKVLEGALDRRALAGALIEVVRRHEGLRTTFVEGPEGEPVQRIAPEPAGFVLPWVDLSGLPLAAGEEEARRLAVGEARRPFDLARGPLLRCLLVERAEEHVLFFTLHHIISDDWSMGLLADEVELIYQAILEGRPSPLEPLTLQPADFAVWQRRRGPVVDEALAWWRRYLEGVPALLELPTDRPRPAVRRGLGGQVSATLDAALLDDLHRLGQGIGATFFMTVLAALQVVLARHGRVRDLAVGSPIAGRDRVEVEPLIGCFINTLVLRGQLQENPSFLDFLGTLRDDALEAYRHQHLPFEQLVDELQPERSLSHTPLFQVMLVLQHQRPVGEADAWDPARDLVAETGRVQFDLTWSLAETASGCRVQVAYDRDLFDACTVRRLTSHFETLLRSAVAEPGQPVTELSLLGAGERHQLTVEWGDTHRGLPGDESTLHGLVALQATLRPDSVAVLCPGADGLERSLSYRELHRRTLLWADRLRRHGAGPEVLVGLYMERSVEMILGILAILESGAAYLPLDPEYPEERLRFMRHDADLPVLLTQESLRERLGQTTSEVVVLDPAVAFPAMGLEPELDPPTDADHLAYMIYTSGTTGHPKGVMVAHRAAVNRVLRAVEEGPRGETHLHKAPLSFDVSVEEIFVPLATGARLLVAPPGAHRDTAWMARGGSRHRITSVHFVPSLLAAFLEEPELDGWYSLMALFSGGEALPMELARRCLDRLGCTLYNLYGPTEATVDAATCRVSREMLGSSAGSSVVIGRPVGNLRIHLLTPTLEPVPLGAVGELHIGGVGLARGYRGRPGRTAEVFLPDPAVTEVGGRLYRTGDLGRHRTDGSLEFLRRADRQVKLRGLRIELGEIEAHLARHPAVGEAAVILHQKPGLGARLVAYWVARGDHTPDPSELQSFLAESLPAHMVPALVQQLPEFPLSPSGKVDRAALPEPELGDRGAVSIAPCGAMEVLVAGLWAEVLDLEQVGATDDFFDLGGHSLLATRLISRLRRALGIELEVRHLFESPTVAGLAAIAQQVLAAGGGAPLAPMKPLGEEAWPLPLSFGQQRLWILEQIESGNPAYHIPGVLELRGPLDVAVLAAALRGVEERHQALRVRFEEADPEPVQTLAPADPRLPQVDLGALPEARAEEEDRRVRAVLVRAPFDLARGPLWRRVLVRRGPQHHVLSLTLHHMVSDAWSMGILVGELVELYQAARSGSAAALPALPVQYADFATWQRDWLTGEALEAQIAHWRQELLGAPAVLELPLDRPRPPVRQPLGARVSRRLPAALTARLHRLGADHRATTFMVFLAALQTLLGRLAGQRDVVIGTTIAGRHRAEIEGLIGFFVNTLVLRGELTESGEAAGPEFGELLARARGTALAAYAHQDLPFEKLVDELQVPRSLTHTPLFQAMLNYQNVPTEVPEVPELEVSMPASEVVTARFDLSLEVTEVGEEMGLDLVYDAGLFDRTTVARLLGQLEGLLRAVVDEPLMRIFDLPWMSPAQHHQVVVEWNATSAAYDFEGGLAGRIWQRTEEMPEAVAVFADGPDPRSAGTWLSYGELGRRALGLAARLHRRGLGPGALVGLSVERSVELPIALLAVLRIGAAYVPLDPGDPAERLAVMVEDSGLQWVLTRQGEPPGHLQEGLARLDSSLSVEILAVRGSFDEPGPGEQASKALETLRPVVPEDLAFLIFTSGSTGRPKGAMNTHGAIVNRLAWKQRIFGLDSSDAVLQKTPVSFDVSVWEIFWPLWMGARTVLAQPGAHRDPSLLIDLILRGRITTAHFIPTLFDLFLEEPEAALCRSLRRVLCGGEALAFEQRERFAALGLTAEHHNLYGPAEAAIDVTHHVCGGERGRVVPIGRPIHNLEIHLLDQRFQPVPVGVVGEIHIGGIGLGRGYRHRASWTADRFVPDPFRDDPGARLYRSGDLARLDPFGNIQFMGRRDHQVKLYGLRIELGEIEATLREMPGVGQAVVGLHESEGRRRLVAYVVPQPLPEADSETPSEATVLDGDAWRQDLARTLPKHMIPAVFLEVPALPLTATGKTDRAALLRRPLPDEPSSGEAAVAASTEYEAILVDIWQQVLGRREVGVHDNFFELGGDSILAIQTVTRARQRSVHLTVQQMFELQTIAELAQVAEASGGVLAEQGLVVGPVPLTAIQRRFFERRWGRPQHFNQSLLLAMDDDVSPALMARTLAELLQHHDALRMRFDGQVDEPASWSQYCTEPALTVPWVHLDLSAVPEEECGALVEHAAAAIQGSLSLDEGPILRGAWLDLGPGRGARLLWVFHHLVVDGVSWRILLEDVAEIYGALAQGEAVRLPAKTTSFKRWAEAVEDLAQSPEVLAEADYWLAEGRRQVEPLPVDFTAPTLLRQRTTRTVEVALSAEETRELLEDVPPVYQTRIEEALLTALAEAFRAWTGCGPLLVDLEGHGREPVASGIDPTRTVGWFTTVFPLLLEPSGGELGTALQQVKEGLRGVPRRGLGYGLLRYGSPGGEATTAEKLGALPQAEVSFNYLGRLDGGTTESAEEPEQPLLFAAAPESPGPTIDPDATRPYLIEIDGSVSGGRLRAHFVYSPEVHSSSTIEGLAEGFLAAIRALLVHCRSPEAGGFTPSDFPDLDLDAEDLEGMFEEAEFEF